MMQKFLAVFYGYALVIGLISYKHVNERFRQTGITRTYAWIVNLGLLAALPYNLWTVAKNNSSVPLVPSFIKIAPYILTSINYAVIMYTLALRGLRDNITLDMQRLITQINREMARSGKKTSSKLWRLFYLKISILLYKSLSQLLSSFIYGTPLEFRNKPQISSLVLNIGKNLVAASEFLYFLAFWEIVRGYEFINERLEELIPHSKSNKKELSRLWALHLKLGKTLKRIHGLFGPQMLAARLNYFLSNVMNGYIGILLWKDKATPCFFVYSRAIQFVLRSLDSFLHDYIIGLASEYQSKRRDSITEEETMSKEVIAYIIYESSMKFDLKICGLFTANKMAWLQMMELILTHFIVLLQFHLVLGRN
ncbi:hypothetical protein KR054_002736 [Drosophila jambulina]|nr:hypothetical protein KR054_002736 [Drosophila jambulina]